MRAKWIRRLGQGHLSRRPLGLGPQRLVRLPVTPLRKLLIVAAAALAALAIGGCDSSYNFHFYSGCKGPLGACGQHQFTQHQDSSARIILGCTQSYGKAGRADCALRLIGASCQQSPPPNFTHCADAADVHQYGGYTTNGGSMEAAIEQVTGPQECLSWLEYVFPGDVVYGWWQGTDVGTYGCQ
jgi:hypothetical protein